MTLYVCGDSYASLVLQQPAGRSWSELLADRLNVKLINLARPAAANSIISIQLDYVLENLQSDDTVIVFLTDHFRLIESSGIVDSEVSLLEQVVLHQDQRPTVNYVRQSIASGSVNNPRSETMRIAFTAFDPLVQYYLDKQIMLGTLSRLRQQTNQFLVVSGGWGRSLPGSAVRQANDDLNLNHQNFLDYTVRYLEGLNESPAIYINHLTDLAHAKLAVNIYQKLQSWG